MNPSANLFEHPNSPILTAPIEVDQACKMLTEFGILEITGDARTFLQGQLTVDIDDINESTSQLGGYCNLKGRLHALYLICKPEFINGYWLIMPQSILEHTLNTLKGYARFSKVTLKDVSTEVALFAQYGQSPLLLNQHNHPLGITQQSNNLLEVSLGNQLSLLCGPKVALNIVWNALDVPVSNAWNWFLIERGIPFIHLQSIEFFLAHYLNLDTWGGISFKKGCYLGQEIVARMHYKGDLKKHLYHIRLESSQLFEPATPLYHPETEQLIGHVVLSTVANNQCSALVSLQDNYNLKTLFALQRPWVIAQLRAIHTG